MKKARGFIFTWNNYTDEDVKEVQSWAKSNTQYLVYGLEIAPTTGTPHLQGYFYFSNPRSWENVKNKFFNGRTHIEIAKTTIEAINYCKEDGKWWEHGEKPKQGNRIDLKAVVDSIMKGEVTCEDILIEDPLMFHQYGRTLEKAEAVYLKKQFRLGQKTQGIWYYGPTAVGKSHRAFNGYGPETHYNVPKDEGWWDNYTQQKIVVINEFRGEILYSRLLELCDEWPTEVRRRGKAPMPFKSDMVVITSPFHPQELFKNIPKNDKWEQFFRRFTVIECLSAGTEVVRGNNEL